jgi:hypothetical protein
MTRSMTAAPEPITVDPPASPAVAPLPVALHDVTFLHWRYNPELVRPLLPPGTAPDRFDGAASVGLVALRIRSYGEFLQFNVRTYTVDQRTRRAATAAAASPVSRGIGRIARTRRTWRHSGASSCVSCPASRLSANPLERLNTENKHRSG